MASKRPMYIPPDAIMDSWTLVNSPKPTSSKQHPRQTHIPTTTTTTSSTDTPKHPDKHITGIHASLLIPGKGEPLQDQAIILSSHTGKILSLTPITKIPSEYSHIPLQAIPVVMPGMWECHAHFMGASPNLPINSQNMTLTNPAEAGARNARAVKDTLYAGFTSAVELGGYATELARVVEEGSILGPRLYGSGAAISMTAGHGDVFELPYGCAHQKLSVNAPGTDAGTVTMMQADGIEECRKAVRLNLRRGAKAIKVFTTGGVTSLSDNPVYAQFSPEELAVIVSEATRMGMICAAHAVGKAGIMAAINAGFKVIEHGSYADEEVFAAMKKHDVTLVATITPLESIAKNEDKYPPAMYRKAMELYTLHRAAYRAAVKAGVRCALGSDLFGGIGTVLSPGLNGMEVPLAVSVGGMTPLQAIEAATANGPYTLGPQAPRSGVLKEGWDADLLGLERNPIEEIEVLARPGEVRWIWNGGRLVKAPGLDAWDVLAR